MINKIKLKKDERLFETPESSAKILSLSECLDRDLLISPDTKLGLTYFQEKEDGLTDGQNNYALISGSPLLYPSEITDNWHDGELPFVHCTNALGQYVLLSQIKQAGEINAPLDSIPARKHQYRFMKFCEGLSGLVLDIGSDRPSHSSKLLSSKCEYLGLDPYAGQGEFRVIGLGEILPIKQQSVDAILFNTSLDHILDYHTAIGEAYRVLKPGGYIVISSYAWLEKATLLTDNVHFHHFREYEILGALEENFQMDDIQRYEDPKHAAHRYGLYIRAKRV